jgi:hypothetical protein
MEKTPEELQKEEQKRVVEERQEKIVADAREKILPILKEKNLSIDNSKLICDLLAIAINQGQFELLSQHKVEDLKLLDFITDNYPQVDVVREVLTTINDMSMMEAINTLQWMVAKINKVIEDENKERSFEDLKLDF